MLTHLTTNAENFEFFNNNYIDGNDIGANNFLGCFENISNEMAIDSTGSGFFSRKGNKHAHQSYHHYLKWYGVDSSVRMFISHRESHGSTLTKKYVG